jgi:transposase
MQKKNAIVLSPKEKSHLAKILEENTLCPEQYRRAKVLSLISEGLTDLECSRQALMSPSGVKKVRVRCSQEGFDRTITGKPRGHRPKALKAETEAKLAVMASEKNVNGRKAWTLKTLREYVLEAEGVFLTLESIRRIVKRQTRSEEQAA